MTNKQEIKELIEMANALQLNPDTPQGIALKMAIQAIQAWDKFKQALDKRIIEQGFDEDEWSISYNELIKMMKKCGGIE